MRYSILFILSCSFIFLACPKHEDYRNSSIRFNLTGPKCCIETIEMQEGSTTRPLDATAVLVAETETTPEIAFLTFYDQVNKREVSFTIPTSNADVYLLTHDSDYFMGILLDDLAIYSGVKNTIYGVSIHIKKFKPRYVSIGFGTVEEFEVSFQGIMSNSYYDDDGKEVIDQYDVNGEFNFYTK